MRPLTIDQHCVVDREFDVADRRVKQIFTAMNAEAFQFISIFKLQAGERFAGKLILHFDLRDVETVSERQVPCELGIVDDLRDMQALLTLWLEDFVDSDRFQDSAVRLVLRFYPD